MAPMEFACFPPATALFHLAYGMATTAVLMEVMFLGFRKVPFTCAHLPGKVNLVFLGVMYVFGFTAYSRTLRNLEIWLAQSPVAIPAFFALAAAVYLAVSHFGTKLLGPKPVLDYEEPAEPVVRTLGLSAR